MGARVAGQEQGVGTMARSSAAKPVATGTGEELVDELTALAQELRGRPDAPSRVPAVARALRLLADLLQAPPREPEYASVLDHRGTPFGPGEPIPYRKGSRLHRALAIFRDHSLPITRARFVACGGDPRDLDRLVAAGHVARFGG